jgi:CelD/BcsL family acetyltransferase involved in cellulose biosynthesis
LRPAPARHVDVVTDVSDPALRAAWETLGAAVASPLAQHDWFAAAASTVPHDGLHVVVVRDETEVRAVLPLARYGRGIDARLAVIGAPLLLEPTVLPHDDADALTDALRAEARTGLPIVVGRVAVHGPDARAIAALPGVVVVRRPDPGTPRVALAGTFADFEAGMSSSRRSALRRARRRAESVGAVEVHAYVPRPDEVGAHVDAFVAVEAAGWKGEAGTALRDDPLRLGFYRRYAELLAGRAALHAMTLTIDGAPVAAQLAVHHAGSLWLLKIGYDASFAHVSPGMLLTHAAIEWSFEHGLTGFEFLGTDAAWIRTWTDEVTAHVKVAVYPRRPRAAATLALDALRYAARRRPERSTDAPSSTP